MRCNRERSRRGHTLDRYMQLAVASWDMHAAVWDERMPSGDTMATGRAQTAVRSAKADSTTTRGKECSVSIGMTAAIKLKCVVENTHNVLTIEAMGATQAIDYQNWGLILWSQGRYEEAEEKFVQARHAGRWSGRGFARTRYAVTTAVPRPSRWKSTTPARRSCSSDAGCADEYHLQRIQDLLAGQSLRERWGCWKRLQVG